jgi:hypothetical protein
MTERVICWWSAGSASAVATKLALAKYPDALVVYCDLSATEHPDNERFLKQCESWYGKSISRIRSEKYKDTWEVYEKTGWLIGVNGARCTTELKKIVRRAFQRPDDVHVWGFTISEMKRYDAFRANNIDLQSCYPLIEAGLRHADCHAFLKEAGIDLPMMYQLGYKNNNCIGCVKGGMGYWNKIRSDFPEVFWRMAALERRLDVAILKEEEPGTKKRLRVFLDELEPSRGRYEAEDEVQCGVACEAAYVAIRSRGTP